MLESVRVQLEEAKKRYPSLEAQERPDNTIHIIVKDIPLPAKWGRERVNIMTVLPVGYPQAAPNGFSAQMDGQNWSGFCYRPASWNPARDNVWKGIKLIERCFEENNP